MATIDSEWERSATLRVPTSRSDRSGNLDIDV
jgi:hypothetical protein